MIPKVCMLYCTDGHDQVEIVMSAVAYSLAPHDDLYNYVYDLHIYAFIVHECTGSLMNRIPADQISSGQHMFRVTATNSNGASVSIGSFFFSK